MSELHIIKVNDIAVVNKLSEQLLKTIYSPEELKFKKDAGYDPEYLSHVIFVVKDEVPLARTAIYTNPFIRASAKNALTMGNFECVYDTEVAEKTFGEVELFAKQNSYSSIIGPVNGSTWDNYRLSMEGNYPRFFTEELFKNYYSSLFINSGFDILTEYYSTLISDIHLIVEEQDKARDTFLVSTGLNFRGISKESFLVDLEKIYHFAMDAFSGNYLFSPLSRSYFIEKYLPLQQFIDPDYCRLVFDKNNNLVAFFFCLPDILNPNSKTLIVKTIAGKSGRNYAGISSLLFKRVVAKAIQNGYKHIIHAFMHKSNQSLNLSRKYNSKIIRTYQLFVKQLKY